MVGKITVSFLIIIVLLGCTVTEKPCCFCKGVYNEGESNSSDGCDCDCNVLIKPSALSRLFNGNVLRELNHVLRESQSVYFFKLVPPFRVGEDSLYFAVTFKLKEVLALGKRVLVGADGGLIKTDSKFSSWSEMSRGTKVKPKIELFNGEKLVCKIVGLKVRYDNLSPYVALFLKRPPIKGSMPLTSLSCYFNTFGGNKVHKGIKFDTVKLSFDCPLTVVNVQIRKVHFTGSLK